MKILIKEEEIRIIILIIEYLIIILIAINLIINPIKGGIPPKDINEIIILILLELITFNFIKSSRDLILFLLSVLIIVIIIIKYKIMYKIQKFLDEYIMIIIHLKWETDEKIRIFLKSFKLKIIIDLKISEIILIMNVISLFILLKINNGMTFCIERIIINEL